MFKAPSVLLLGSLVLACGSDAAQTPDQVEFGGDRPVFLEVPTSYDHGTPTPLLLVLHGFGANGFTQLRYTKLDELVEEQGILLAAPDGTVNAEGKQFWNATDACCGAGSGVDDVAYLSGLIADISAVWNVDPARVYLFGHSNGGFMSYRMACDQADSIAAIVSLAGATWDDPGQCAPSSDVSVLQIHGTNDQTILYGGGTLYPSATASTEIWAGYDGCGTSMTQAATNLDLEVSLDGAETTVQSFDGCPADVAVELWSIEDGSHLPNVTDGFRTAVWEWLAAHPKQ